MLAVAVVTAVGAAVRFYQLGAQGFWYDEAYSAHLIELTPDGLLDRLPGSESTPPLYYIVAWVWARLSGTGETALRSLSALAGTVVVPVAFLIGQRLASVRAGFVLASLTACSPLLVWYSQEARSYSLLVLLSASSLLAYVLARERAGGRQLLFWAVSSALALATHYLALILVVPEAASLLVAQRRRPGAWAAVAAVAAAGVPLVPLALAQHETPHTRWVGRIPLGLRLEQLGSQFPLGFGASVPIAVVAVSGLALGLLLLARAGERERRAAVVAVVLGGGGVLIALGLVALGFDAFLTRNLLAVWLPLALVVAIGLASARPRGLGALATVAVCAAWLAAIVAVDTTPGLQRPDWRRVAQALGPTNGARVVVLEHYRAQIPLLLYRPHLARLDGLSPAVREVDVVAPDVPVGRSCWWGAACNLSNGPDPHPLKGFALGREVELPNFDFHRLTSDRPRRVQLRFLRRELRHVRDGAVLLERR